MTAHLPATPADAPEWPPLTQAERNRLVDAAMAEAHELRRRAITEFWRGANELVAGMVGNGRRAADRLAARLLQHAKQRQAAPAVPKP